MIFFFLTIPIIFQGFHGGSDGKESACNVADLGSIPVLGRFPWRKEGLPTPIFCPGEYFKFVGKTLILSPIIA